MNESDDTDDSGTPYEVKSRSRVWLSRTARQLASMHNMSERDMARHLLNQARLKQAGLVQKDNEES
jgi:hypothetical protein